MNLAIHLDRGTPMSLQDQLFEQLRQMILSGHLKPNSRVIATRFLADQAGVSRTTVLLAYDRLISEGYLETRPAVGTFVSATPPEQPGVDRSIPSCEARAACEPDGCEPGLTSEFDFSRWRKDASHLLPDKAWLQGLRNVLDKQKDGLGVRQPSAGATVLRQAIVDHLAASRGVVASPDDVVIVAGRRQACTLIAHAVLARGDRIVVESPGDEDINTIFRIRGGELLRAPVDEQGADTARLPAGPVRLAYVTPARQNPVGGTMPTNRRAELLAWAHTVGAFIIEDDCDASIRYHGTPPRPLKVQDPDGRVFYTGSFSETLGAGVGLGYLVAPTALVDTILAIKSAGEEAGAWLEQMIVADLLTTGAYDKHIRRVRKIYLERRDCLIDALRTKFGDVRLVGDQTGAQLTWILPGHWPSAQHVCDLARLNGVILEPVLSDLVSDDNSCLFHDRAVILGYAGLPPDQLRDGVSRLHECLQF